MNDQVGNNGNVDNIIFRKQKVAVYVDGCFWHMCPTHGTLPRSNAEWWRKKLHRNVERDRETDMELREAGWSTIRIWEHELAPNAAERITEALLRRLRD